MSASEQTGYTKQASFQNVRRRMAVIKRGSVQSNDCCALCVQPLEIIRSRNPVAQRPARSLDLPGMRPRSARSSPEALKGSAIPNQAASWIERTDGQAAVAQGQNLIVAT